MNKDYYDKNDVLQELLELMDPPCFLDKCDFELINEATKHIKQLRGCLRCVLDAYLNGDEFNTDHKQLVLSSNWKQWASECLKHHKTGCSE